MAWDAPSVNRNRRPGPAAPAGVPARPVSFSEILRRIVLALLAGLVCGWAASWVLPGLGSLAWRLADLGVGLAGFALALRLQWRPSRHGLPQHVLDGADRRWIGGRQYDPEPSDYLVAEGLVEVIVDIAAD